MRPIAALLGWAPALVLCGARQHRLCIVGSCATNSYCRDGVRPGGHITALGNIMTVYGQGWGAPSGDSLRSAGEEQVLHTHMYTLLNHTHTPLDQNTDDEAA